MLLEIRSASGQFYAPYVSSWRLLWGHPILRHPCHFEAGLLIDKRPKRNFLKESMLLHVWNLHMRIGDTLTNPCFSAQFSLDACHCEDGYLAQLMALWLEAFMWCSDSSELLPYLES
jgi:hypothetical protein